MFFATSLARLSVGLLLLAGCLATNALGADTDGRFQQALALNNGQHVVVAEGEFEPRSTGSYSARLYASQNPEFPFDDFIIGVVLPRDGFIETVQVVVLPMLAIYPAPPSPGECFAVIQRNVGSGSYRSGEILCVKGSRFELRAHVSGLAAEADVLAELLKRFQ
jgi:hypothetical protein